VHDEISGKINAEWEDLGQQTFKNISQGVRTYRVKPVNSGLVKRPPLALPDKPSIPEMQILPGSAMLSNRAARQRPWPCM
jgi:hypothetical protein